ncbi:hypothetical protein AUR64_12130 [Haloprofundus marisrubri]|uniref:Uncharacterized protein n=1 Tax=Haloprofundus marisrubri TaxID=1514971 RepID=A0A0W1RA21_9EURY|nr:hypothetical protein AUR64_12130 [Haloprofundus marisrubri]
MDIRTVNAETRTAAKDFVGWLLVSALLFAGAAAFRLPLRNVAAVVVVFLSIRLVELLVAGFDLPRQLVRIYPGVLLALGGIYLAVTGESPALAAFCAFAAGWMLRGDLPPLWRDRGDSTS